MQELRGAGEPMALAAPVTSITLGGVMNGFEAKAQTIPLYIGSAQTYLELSLALLVATVAFREKILGLPPGARPSRLIAASWASLSLSICANVLYQYVAVKHLAAAGPVAGKQPGVLGPLIADPGIAYGSMVVLFALGAVLFGASASRNLYIGNQPTA